MKQKFFTILVIFCSVLVVYSGTTGKITGRITDASTGEPLIGANIVVKNTYLGGATDLDGYYVILNVPPGEFTIEATYIGYTNTEVSGVRVSIDLTTKINITLTEATLSSTDEIVVVADRQEIKKDLTASTAIVGGEEIRALPVTEISEVLNLQAGFVDGHMRGGRAGEVAYWVDGIPVTDSYDGETVVDVNKDMVQELQVISGAFNAEYGNAMSGIVNIVTKSGANDFGGSFTTYFGDHFSTNDDIFWNTKNFNPLNIYNFDGTLHGSIIRDRVFFYLNARHIHFNGWYYGKEVYKPNNVAYTYNDENNQQQFLNYRDSEGQGNGDYVPMNGNRKNYGQVKLIFRLSPSINIISNSIYDDVNYKDYDRNYKLNPNGDLNRFRTGFVQMFKMTHILSPATFYDLAFSGFMKEYKHYVYEDAYDARYVHPDLGELQLPYSFKTGGNNMSRFKRETLTLLGKFDLTSQISKTHQIKTGAEFRQYRLMYEDITLQPTEEQEAFNKTSDSPFITTRIDSESSINTTRYTRRPLEASLYIQDKIEFEEFILNIGVRFDYFDVAWRLPADLTDPDINDPRKTENSEKTLAEREQYWYRDTEPKFQISPRIGAAFPISSTGKVYFSYGYFFQRPSFERLYTNPDFHVPDTGPESLMGNPDLDPEKTVQGELGIQQALTQDILVDATIFFRDIRGLTGTKADLVTIPGGRRYAIYSNSDLGLIKGFVLSFSKRMSNNFAANIDYTFQVAEGTASNPDDALNAVRGGALPEVQLIPLNWDQRHTINGSFTYTSSSWGSSVLLRYGSGLPYTPNRTQDISVLLTNRGIKPATTTVDLRLYKDFTIANIDIILFARVFNLFDTLNEINVYQDSGRAGYTSEEPTEQANNPPEHVNTLSDWYNNATHFSEPRRVELGFTVTF